MHDYLAHVAVHLALAGAGLVCGAALGGAAGYAAFLRPRFGAAALHAVAALRVVPSLAVLVALLPSLGIGAVPAVVALTLLAAAPIALALDAGLRSVAPEMREAAEALGMDARTLRRRVLWPLAVPTLFGGVRTAAVEVVASATLAAFVGGGGLGEYILEGLADGDARLLLVGGATVAALAWGAELLCAAVGRALSLRYAAA